MYGKKNGRFLKKTAYRTARGSVLNRSGASLPLVICAGAFLIAFSLALVYTAGLMMSSAKKKTENHRCYELAKSFAKQMEQELKKDGSSFQTFVNGFLEENKYSEYIPDNPYTVYQFLAVNTPDQYGTIKLRMYKEKSDDSPDSLSGTLPLITTDTDTDKVNFSDIVTATENKKFQRYTFFLEIVAESGNMSYNYVTEYVREDNYGVTFKHDNRTIVWGRANESDEMEWHEGNTSGPVYKGWINSLNPITYQYDETVVKSREYKNQFEDMGGEGP